MRVAGDKSRDEKGPDGVVGRGGEEENSEGCNPVPPESPSEGPVSLDEEEEWGWVEPHPTSPLAREPETQPGSGAPRKRTPATRNPQPGTPSDRAQRGIADGEDDQAQPGTPLGAYVDGSLVGAVDLLAELLQLGAGPRHEGERLAFEHEEVLTPELRARCDDVEEDLLVWLDLAGPDCLIEYDPPPFAQVVTTTPAAIESIQRAGRGGRASSPGAATTRARHRCMTRAPEPGLFPDEGAQEAK